MSVMGCCRQRGISLTHLPNAWPPLQGCLGKEGLVYPSVLGKAEDSMITEHSLRAENCHNQPLCGGPCPEDCVVPLFHKVVVNAKGEGLGPDLMFRAALPQSLSFPQLPPPG